MNPQLNNLLYERYPKIFPPHPLPESQMHEGFTCGDGWFELIDALCEQLQFDIDHNGTPQIVARQVKEKTGTLRFYAGKVTDEQRGMILFAGFFAGRICEVCGKTGKSQNSYGYVVPRCSEHMETT